jgi:hypothetical protein
MKKKLITVFILFNSLVAYCQHPYLQDLQSEARMTFPDTPKVDFSDGATYYTCRINNNLYFAQVTDLNKINPDSLNSNIHRDIYDQFIDGVINPLKGEVFYTEKIEVSGQKGVAFDYKCKLNGNTYYGYQQVFRFNDALVSYSLLSPDSLRRDDQKIKSFFDTFISTPARVAASKKQSSTMVGILMISSILFWVTLVGYLIKRFKKKKSYEWPGGQ